MRRLVVTLMLVGVLLLVAGSAAPAWSAGPPAPSASSAKLKVDQANLVTSPEGLGMDGVWGQTFVPKAPNLAQVDLLLTVNQLGPAGATTTVGIFADLTGTPIAAATPIATATAFVPDNAPGELARFVGFSFDPAVPLAKKTTYTIGWYGRPIPSDLSWQFSYDNPYPAGQMLDYSGAPSSSADFVFITYTLKP